MALNYVKFETMKNLATAAGGGAGNGAGRGVGEEMNVSPNGSGLPSSPSPTAPPSAASPRLGGSLQDLFTLLCQGKREHFILCIL